MVAPLGPRAICGGLLKRVGSELVFAEANPRLVARGNPTRVTVGVFRGTDPWRQSLGPSGGYLLRLRVGRRGIWGYGGSARGRRV